LIAPSHPFHKCHPGTAERLAFDALEGCDERETIGRSYEGSEFQLNVFAGDVLA
jgi:hypothetical protein